MTTSTTTAAARASGAIDPLEPVTAATIDAHDALAAIIRDAAPTIHDPAYLAAQLLNDRYWHRRYTREIPTRTVRYLKRERERYAAVVYATDRTLAAVLDRPAYDRITKAADLHAGAWEAAAWQRDNEIRAEFGS